MPKVQPRESTRGDRNPKSSVSRGAGHWSSGRVGKPYAKPAEDRKLKTTAKNTVTAKGIVSDPSQHPEKNENEKDDPLVYKQKMTITVHPERKCTDSEIEKIQDALINAFEPLEDGLYPQFYGSFLVKGTLVVTCANEQTKLWLERVVPNLDPWEGGKLRVKVRGEIMQGTKVLLKTPKLFAKTDPKKILQMLSTQNKTLDTSTWKNVSAKSEDSGQTLIYIVDNQSLEAIRALDNKVYLGLGNVELVIVNNDEDKKTSADTTKDDKKVSADTGKDDKNTSADTGKDDKNESTDTAKDDKQASADTAKDDKQASADTGKDDEKASADTAKDDKKASADAGKDDKKTSSDTGKDDKKASADKGKDDMEVSAETVKNEKE